MTHFETHKTPISIQGSFRLTLNGDKSCPNMQQRGILFPISVLLALFQGRLRDAADRCGHGKRRIESESKLPGGFREGT